MIKFSCRLVFGFSFFCCQVLSNEECVRRKLGACKVFHITGEFDKFVTLRDNNLIPKAEIVIEIDRLANKYSYEHKSIQPIEEQLDEDNPIVEILFSEIKQPGRYSFRLVLGEKLGRLAYLEKRDDNGLHVEYNNYSPHLPTWPFSIKVLLEYDYDSNTNISVYNIKGSKPFLTSYGHSITPNFISMRSRNKNANLVGFYGCSSKFGLFCGIEETQPLENCRIEISPLGGGLYRYFADITQFNRAKEKDSFVFEEYFAVYRKNDNMHILFSEKQYERDQYIRLTIGNDIELRVRNFNTSSHEYYEKTLLQRDFNEQPKNPYFIKVKISSETKNFLVYSVKRDSVPIMSLKLCDYFNRNKIQYMSVTSDHFKTVSLYYDCCKRYTECHINKKNNQKTYEMSEITTIDKYYDDDEDVDKIEDKRRDESEEGSGDESEEEDGNESAEESGDESEEENGDESEEESEDESEEESGDESEDEIEDESGDESTNKSGDYDNEDEKIDASGGEDESLDANGIEDEIGVESEDEGENEGHNGDKVVNEHEGEENYFHELTIHTGLHFTKEYLSTRKFYSNQPLYRYENGDSYSDWCQDEIKEHELFKSIASANEDDTEDVNIDPKLLSILIG